MNRWIHNFLNLLYPPLCLHCKTSLKDDNKYLCDLCTTQLEILDTHTRCPRCFSADYCKKRHLCGACQKTHFAFTQLASVFEHIGPAATLVQKMKYGGQSYLANGAAPFLAVQFVNLEWPIPDIIVPVPISPLRHFERGYNQSKELAVALSTYLQRPVVDALKREMGGFSQAGMTRKRRISLGEKTFMLRKAPKLYDKVILLIDDVTTTGSTLNCCAEALQQECPQAIYALTVSRAAT